MSLPSPTPVPARSAPPPPDPAPRPDPPSLTFMFDSAEALVPRESFQVARTAVVLLACNETSKTLNFSGLPQKKSVLLTKHLSLSRVCGIHPRASRTREQECQRVEMRPPNLAPPVGAVDLESPVGCVGQILLQYKVEQVGPTQVKTLKHGSNSPVAQIQYEKLNKHFATKSVFIASCVEAPLSHHHHAKKKP